MKAWFPPAGRTKYGRPAIRDIWGLTVCVDIVVRNVADRSILTQRTYRAATRLVAINCRRQQRAIERKYHHKKIVLAHLLRLKYYVMETT